MSDDLILELKTVQGNPFKRMIESLKEIIIDANWEFQEGDNNNDLDCDKGYVKVVATDTSQTVLAHLKLEGKSFERYRCTKRTIIGVNLGQFYKLIKCMTINDYLTLYISEKDPNKLGIRIQSGDKPIAYNYGMSLIDLDHGGVEMEQSEIQSDVVIVMQSNDFQKICRHIKDIGDEKKVEIKNFNKQLYFSCDASYCDGSIVLGEHEGLSFTYNSDKMEVIQGYYNIYYLALFTKCSDLSTSMKIYMRNDFPLILEYPVGSLGKLKLAVAPKVD